jgi:hypothetical protein
MYNTTKAFISLVRNKMYLLKKTQFSSALMLYMLRHVEGSLELMCPSAYLLQ